jgi:hypothetical protein
MPTHHRQSQPLSSLLLNIGLFQGCWLICVLGGANGLPWLGLFAAAAVVWAHLRAAPRPRREALLIAAATALGAFWDGQIAGHGWVAYTGGTPARWLPPLWIIAMWASFATLLNRSLRFLHGRYGLALVTGGLLAPIAYAAGAALGAAAFPDKMVAMLAIGGGWALLLPVLVALAARWDGFAAIPYPAAADAQRDSAETARGV